MFLKSGLGQNEAKLADFRHLGGILGVSWAILGYLGPSWGHLGAILGHLGGILGHLGASCGHFGAILAASCSILGHLGATWSPKELKLLFFIVFLAPGGVPGSGTDGRGWRARGTVKLTFSSKTIKKQSVF